MTKPEAEKVKPGDGVILNHQELTVVTVVTEHPDPRCKLPLFRLSNDNLVTYRLLERVSA